MANEATAAGVPRSRAPAVLAYMAVVTLVAKVARVIELTARTGDHEAWIALPMMFGEDLVLLAGATLLIVLIEHFRRPRLTLGVAIGLLGLTGTLLASDVLAHKLTGSPITWQRLMGKEGATLLDLELLDMPDLIAGVVGIAAAWCALWVALRFADRLAWVVKWARARKLLVTLVVGALLAAVQGALLPQDYGLAQQPVFVLAESVVASDGPAARAISTSGWRKLHRPSHKSKVPMQTPLLGKTRARNVIIFFAEGIPFKHTGFAKDKRRKRNPTPNLVRRWRQHGLLFDRYYANWHASIQAIFSLVCSQFPPLNGDIVRIKPRIDCGELSEVMRARGVVPGLFHGGEFAFYNKLALLGGRGYAITQDAEELARTSRRARNQWGIDDRAMVDATLAWIDTLPKGERFAALLIPITAHYPYWVPRDFRGPFRGRGKLQRFLNAVAFSDATFEQLARGLEQRGLYDDTLMLWLGDHGHSVEEPSRRTPGVRGFYQPNLHTPLVMLHPGLFPTSSGGAGRTSHRIGGHVDLLPTILDALDLPPDPRHDGQSLLSPNYEPRRVFYGAMDGRYVGFVEHDTKFTLDLRKGRTEFYDIARDPEEMTDLSRHYPELMRKHSQDVRRFASAVSARIEAAPLLHERTSVRDVYPLVRRNAVVSVVREGKRVVCTPDDAGTGRVCPDIGAVLSERTGWVQGEKRHCLMLRVPAKASIDLEVTDPAALHLMHGTIVALPGRPDRKVRVRVVTRVDGKRMPAIHVSAFGAQRPKHPLAQRSLSYAFSHTDETEAMDVCVQLTTLVQ